MTPTPEQIAALADRCERASGPDRELNIAIHTLIDPQHVAYMDADYAEMKATIEARGEDAIKHRLPGLRAHTHNPPRYTASLDAAMTLVPEGWSWRAEDHGTDGAYASVWRQGWHDDTVIHANPVSSTPALALCAAALRARAAILKEQENG